MTPTSASSFLISSSTDDKPWQSMATFKKFVDLGDKDGSLGISKEELKAGLANGSLRSEELRQSLVKIADTDKNGTVSAAEYGAMNKGIDTFYSSVSEKREGAPTATPTEITAKSFSDSLVKTADSKELGSTFDMLFGYRAGDTDAQKPVDGKGVVDKPVGSPEELAKLSERLEADSVKVGSEVGERREFFREVKEKKGNFDSNKVGPDYPPMLGEDGYDYGPVMPSTEGNMTNPATNAVKGAGDAIGMLEDAFPGTPEHPKNGVMDQGGPLLEDAGFLMDEGGSALKDAGDDGSRCSAGKTPEPAKMSNVGEILAGMAGTPGKESIGGNVNNGSVVTGSIESLKDNSKTPWAGITASDLNSLVGKTVSEAEGALKDRGVPDVRLIKDGEIFPETTNFNPGVADIYLTKEDIVKKISIKDGAKTVLRPDGTVPERLWNTVTSIELNSLVGKPVEEAADFLDNTGAGVQIIGPNTLFTADYVPGRARVFADEAGITSSISIEGGASTTRADDNGKSDAKWLSITEQDLNELVGEQANEVKDMLLERGVTSVRNSSDMDPPIDTNMPRISFSAGRATLTTNDLDDVTAISIDGGPSSMVGKKTESGEDIMIDRLPNQNPVLQDKMISEWLNGDGVKVVGDVSKEGAMNEIDMQIAAWLNGNQSTEIMPPKSNDLSDKISKVGDAINDSIKAVGSELRLSPEADPSISDTPATTATAGVDGTLKADESDLVTVPNPEAIVAFLDNVKVAFIDLAKLAAPTPEAEANLAGSINLFLSALDADRDGVISPQELEFGISLTDITADDVQYLASLVTPPVQQQQVAV
jgi:hypothetical protein